jgi:hypothetical protein
METQWFTDADLIAKLTATEDQFVERKPKGDKGGWLRSTVAFANSTPIGYPAVLFIGVNDSGNIAEGLDVEDLMKSFSDCIAQSAWPPIYTAPRVLEKDRRSCIAVLIPGSDNRPHFAGKAYVRMGTQTKDASEEQYRELTAQIISKARELLRWKGRSVSVAEKMGSSMRAGGMWGQRQYTVEDCNAFYVTLANEAPVRRSLPLNKIDLSFDNQNNQLKIDVDPS